MISVLDRFPQIFPGSLENHFPSSVFEEIEKCFTDPLLKQCSVYPVDMYNIIDDNKLIATIIDIAAAGISKDNISIKIENNKLIVDILPDKNKETVEIGEKVYKKEYVQHQLANRSAHISWSIGSNIDKKCIKITRENGVISIYLPYIKKEDPEVITFNID